MQAVRGAEVPAPTPSDLPTVLSAEEQRLMNDQIALSKSLALGIALSVLPVAGIGSIAAIIIGLRAKRKLAASSGKLTGAGAASWCVIAGSVGLIINMVLIWPGIVNLHA